MLKPWDPAEENLYPVWDDLLADWQATYHPPFRGLRMVGHRWSPDNHRIKVFLGRHQVPFRWIDGGTAAADPSLRQHLDAANTLPIVLFPDGSLLASPSNAEANFYDFVIIGGGPAGLAAAFYAASEGLKTLLIDRDAPGGQASLSSRIENYLGFPAGLSGNNLTRLAVDGREQME